MRRQVQCAPEFHNNFCQKKIFLFFQNNFTRSNHYKFIHHTSHLKPFLSYLPYIVWREYFSIIFNVKKCALYLIIYGTFILGRKISMNGMIRQKSFDTSLKDEKAGEDTFFQILSLQSCDFYPKDTQADLVYFNGTAHFLNQYLLKRRALNKILIELYKIKKDDNH